MLDQAALKELLTKKMVRPAAKREAVVYLRNVLRMSERQACLLLAADRKMVRYRSRRPLTLSCALGCAISPTSAAGLATDGCSFCCGNRASRRASTGSIDSTGRKG